MIAIPSMIGIIAKVALEYSAKDRAIPNIVNITPIAKNLSLFVAVIYFASYFPS